MSRRINSNQVHTDEQIQSMQNSTLGKLIFTSYKGEMCGLLIHDNRLIAARVLNDERNRMGAIYIGKIKNVVKNINACFVEIPEQEICFLSEKEAGYPILLNRKYDGRLLEGDEILVQLSKEAQKGKLASLTANISLSNEYVAIAIGSKKIGYSGKLAKERKEEIREWLRSEGIAKDGYFVPEAATTFMPETVTDRLPSEILSQSNFALSLGLVIRTKAAECSQKELLHQLGVLFGEFMSIIATAQHRTCFSCIRQAISGFEMILYEMVYESEYDEIVTDDSKLYEDLLKYVEEKRLSKGIRLYQDDNFSLSKLYSLEQKFDTALNVRVWLKSGGYLVIEPTEALTVIDVNTGKYEVSAKGKALASTSASEKASIKGACNVASLAAYEKINREAAEEVARQLRLRNLSGIILVDFINMESKEQEEELLSYLRELVRKDKIKTNVIDITPLGLVEITRKKSNKPLREQFKSLGRI